MLTPTLLSTIALSVGHRGAPKVQIRPLGSKQASAVLGKQRWRARGGGSGGSLSTSSAAPVPSFGAAGVQDHPTTQQESSLMRKGKAVGVDADLEVRIAQIKQMTLDQIGAFQSRILNRPGFAGGSNS